VHEDGHAFGVAFRGGKGTCVLDDYLTRVANNHFEEIACLVRGKTADSVIVAAVLVPVLQKYGPVVQRAVEAYQVR